MFQETVLNALKKNVDVFGGNNAFCIAEKLYTYIDFAKHISAIRKALNYEDITNKNIGLVANDDIETYASIFAIWLEGFAYVPLHPNQPIERSVEIIDQADIAFVVDSGSKHSFPSVKTIPTGSMMLDHVDLTPRSVSEDDLAYILFTSGSTGKPKGVPITRKNVGAFMSSFWKSGFEVNNQDRCLQAFDLTFDVSVQSFLTPLAKGACTYTIPHNQIKFSYVYGLFEDHKLTFGAMAPSMLRYLRPYFSELNVPSMKLCILTAEASPVDLIKEWSKCVPNADIFDFYGPTEATIYCTYHKFKYEGQNKQINGMLSIGKAMHGLNAIIVDENLTVLGANQKGELCISGDQLTPGYWKNPEKNKESFFETDFNGLPTRFYKTGDSCYFDEDGDIMLAGRLDYQVKIQGYRIELGEIEYHSREYLKGSNAVAVAVDNKTGNTEIALFVEKEAIDSVALLEYLKTKMPYYMIPTKVLLNGTFPLNSNGKVDRNVLKKSITTHL